MNSHCTTSAETETTVSDLPADEPVSKIAPLEDDDFSEDLGQRQPEACSLDEGCERCQ